MRQTSPVTPAEVQQESELDDLIVRLYRVATGDLTLKHWLETLAVTIARPDAWILDMADAAGPKVLARASSERSAGPLGHAVRAGTTVQLVVAGHADDQITAVLETLIPHLERTLDLTRYLGEERDRLQQIAAAVADGLGAGVLIIESAQKKILHCNARAEQLAQSTRAFRMHGGHFRVVANGRKRLDAAIQEILSTPASTGRQVLIGSLEDQTSVLCYRLDRWTRSYVGGTDEVHLILFVSPLSHLPALRSEHLQRFYGLTPKEARLALGLTQGLDLPHLAERHHVSRHTLRAQLKSTLKKTDTRSQAALIRHLLEDPRLLFAPQKTVDPAL